MTFNKKGKNMHTQKFCELLDNIVLLKELEQYISEALNEKIKPNAVILVGNKNHKVCFPLENLQLDSNNGYHEPLGALLFQLEIDFKCGTNSQHTPPTLHGEFDVTLSDYNSTVHLAFDVINYQFDFEADKFIFPSNMQFYIK